MAEFIEFPIFTGVAGELRPWILWLEDFFVRENFTADEKMNMAQSLLEGEAYTWFYRNQKRLPFQSWEDLTDNLWLMFGDFDEFDRFFQEQRVAQKRKRMKTTSLNLQESISSIATIGETITVVEETSAIVAGNLDERASKKKLVSQNQVPVASLEPGLSFSSEILDVSVAWPSEMVSINRVHSQVGFECVKNNINAHHVLDEMLLRRHKFQQRKKPSLSPKSRMFKFKNRTKLSNWSQMDLHQVIDICNVKNLSPCFRANLGLVRKTRTFQCLRFKKQAHMSRVLYQLRMLHDPGGMKQLLPSDMKSMFGRDVHTMLLEKKDAHVDSLIVRINVILSCGVALGKQIQWAEIQKLSLYKEFWIEIMDGDMTKLLNSNGGKLQLYGSVLEVTFVRRLRVNQQHQQQHNKRKLSLSLKTWMFKFKNKILQRHKSITRFHAELIFAAANVSTSRSNKSSDPSSFVLHVKDYSKSGTLIKTDLGTREEVHELSNKEKILKDGEVITFGTGSATYRWSSIPLVFCPSSETFKVDHSVQDAVSSIGAHISPTLSEECTHVLLDLGSQAVLEQITTRLEMKQKFGKNWWYKFKHRLWQRVCGNELLEADVLVPETVVAVRYDGVAAGSFWFTGRIMILLLILGCFRQILFVSFQLPSLRTSSFSRGRVLIQLSKFIIGGRRRRKPLWLMSWWNIRIQAKPPGETEGFTETFQNKEKLLVVSEALPF